MDAITNHDRLALEPLVDRVLAAARLPIQAERKRLWADHQSLAPTAKIPVCVYYEGIPTPQWEPMLGSDPLVCRCELARSIEFDLRRILWMSDNVPDDHIVWPAIVVDAVRSRDASWGVPLAWEGTRAGVDNPLEARRIVAPFSEGIDLSRLSFTDMEVDLAATADRDAQARELVGGRLAVHVRWPDLGHSPFDIAARLCGLESLLVACAETPELVRQLVDFLTRGHIAHHERRARERRINCFREGEYASVGFRVHCWRPDSRAALRPDSSAALRRDSRAALRPDSRAAGQVGAALADEWAYVSAQTSSGLGPRQYAELVEPSSQLLAEPFTGGTVYYHGCECLDAKIDSVARIPNLRRFHVSPWSSLEVAKKRLGGRVVCEVHSNPSEVFFGSSVEGIRGSLQRLVDAGEGIPMDLNLSDIHSVGGRPELLAVWAREAQLAATRQPKSSAAR